MQQKRELKVVLTESFKELVLEEPVDKITIKQITDRAGVIRVTFYNHFQDKYELIEWMILNQILEPVELLLRNNMYQAAMTLIFTNMMSEKELYQKLYRMGGQVTFDSIVVKCIRSVLYRFIVDKTGVRKAKHLWLTPDHLADYYAQSMAFVVNGWIASGMTASPEEMAEIYEYITQRSMFDLLDEMH